MNSILFATTNPRKISEANATLASFNITVEPIKLDINEIQHHDPAEIAKAKAKSAYDIVQKPVVVSDTSWGVPALNGFPGGYMKDVSAWFNDTDWINLLNGHEDRTIYCYEHLAYYDGQNLHHFASEYKGTIINEPRGRFDDNESIDRVTILYGNKTMAEQLEVGEIASAGEVLEHWKQFGKWFIAK